MKYWTVGLSTRIVVRPGTGSFSVCWHSRTFKLNELPFKKNIFTGNVFSDFGSLYWYTSNAYFAFVITNYLACTAAKYCDQRVCNCMSVCLSVRSHVPISPNFLYMLHRDGMTRWRDRGWILLWRQWVLYVLPVMWMASCSRIMERIGQNQKRRVCFVQFVRWLRSCCVYDCMLVAKSDFRHVLTLTISHHLMNMIHQKNPKAYKRATRSLVIATTKSIKRDISGTVTFPFLFNSHSRMIIPIPVGIPCDPREMLEFLRVVHV